MSGAPARGTVPRRPRRHHHHHHHHQQHHHHHQHHHHQQRHHHDNNNREDEHGLENASNYPDKGHSKVNEVNRPKVNPIFLWALQREQRIIEVRCEDYDKRNRIKLTKTARGWRSIPRTASNVYTTVAPTNGHTCVERVCESPAGVASLSSATSSPNSSRWSPATISSSNLPPWSISSTRSGSSSRSSSHLAAISSPSQEGAETSRELAPGDTSSIASRSRIQSDTESINDFDYACTRNATKRRRIGKDMRKRRHRDNICTPESDKIPKALNNTTERPDALLLGTWNNQTVNNENNEEDSGNPLTRSGDTSLEGTTNRGRTNETRKKRKHDKNFDIHKRKKRRRNSESLDSTAAAGLSVMSSPRSWERLMNGTRFLHSGPLVDQSRLGQENDTDKDQAANEPEEKSDDSTARANHFGSIDLERAKKDQHLQPRVVLEQLRLSGSTDTVTRIPLASSLEREMEEEVTEEEEEEEEIKVPEESQRQTEEEFNDVEKCSLGEFDSKDRGQKKTASMPDKSEIRDILSMLDSTGSPVLATDTPAAHLPSSLDSTKTNISSCYGNRDYVKLPNHSAREGVEKIRLPPVSSPTIGRSSTKNAISDVPYGRSSSEQQASRDLLATRLTGRSLVNERRSDSPVTEKERIVNGKTLRKENMSESVDSNLSELGTSSEILEALRSTPGLSVSVTTRLSHPNETRHESPESQPRHPYKRPASAIYLEKLLPGSPQQTRQSAPPTPCAGSSDVTCSQEPSNELTLEAILATPTRTSEKLSASGLAAIVNRLSNRPSQSRSAIDNTGRRMEQRTKDIRLDCLPGSEKTAFEKRENRKTESGVLEKRLQPRERHQNNPHRNHRSPNKSKPSRIVPPAKQLRHLMDNSKFPIPDPLLVPRDRLPALAAAPAIEIPKLLAARPELRLPEALTRPDLLRDPDLLVISLAHLQQVLDQGDGSVCEYTYRPPHPMALGDDDEEEFVEEDEFIEQEDLDDHDEEEEEEEEEMEEEEVDDIEDYEEEEDQDVPEQSLDLYRSESIDAARVRGIIDEKPRNQRRPPKLISCKPIGSLMPGPIDLSRNCGIRSTHPNRSGPTFPPVSRQPDISTTQLPPPPLLRVRSGLLKQESEVSSTEIASPCVQDDSHLWHPLFGSQKRQMQQQHQPPPPPPQPQQQQQSHRTPWHRTTLAS